MRHSHFVVLYIALLASCIFVQKAYAQDKTAQIKAVFLFKFIDYVTWPQNNSPSNGGTFSLCVLGKHSFGRTLNVIASKQNQHKFKIQYFNTTETPKNCHLIFTEDSPSRMKRLKGSLLVSDSSDFARKGGMIEMREEGGKVKLIGNLQRAEEAGFKISSRLLGIMEVIR